MAVTICGSFSQAVTELCRPSFAVCRGKLSSDESRCRNGWTKSAPQVSNSPWFEVEGIAKTFVTRNFLFIIPLITQAVFTEAVMYTYLSLWFSVRARVLGES